MKPQAYQKPTIYNSDGTKAQIGTYDIRTDPLTNSTADGILDYINNNLEALHDKQEANTAPTPAAGDNSTKIATTEFVNAKAENYLPLSGGKMTGVAKFKTNNNVDVTSNTRVEEVTTQGLDKNNVIIGQDFYSSYAPENFHGIRVNNPDTTTGGWADLRVHATASGKCIITSDRHSNLTDGTTDNSNCIPTTAWLHSHYLPLSGGTLTGVVNGVTPPNDDNSTKIATTEFVNAKAGNYLPLSGGTLIGQLIINKNNGTNASNAGIKITGAGQNYILSASNTNVTKGTAPSSAQYWGIDFYGKDIDSYNKRIGMIEANLSTGNVSSNSLIAYNCTTNTNTNICKISVNVDGNGNAYTSAPTPATDDNSTKIATTAFVNAKAGNYLPLSGGTLTGRIWFDSSEGGIGIASSQNEAGRLRLMGGNGYNKGAQLLLNGQSVSSNPGHFQLSATDTTNTASLYGFPDGRLTWAGKTVIVGTEATETFTFNINANEAKTVGTLAHTPKYYSMMATGTGFTNCVFNISTNSAVWCLNLASVARTNITVKVNYIY